MIKILKRFLTIALLGLFVILFGKSSVYSMEISIMASYNSFFLEVHQPSWVNKTPSLSIGLSKKNFSFSCGFLYSEIFESGGYKFGFSYEYYGLRAGAFGDWYYRASLGGVGFYLDYAIPLNSQIDLRPGVYQSWLTGEVVPKVSLCVGVCK